MEKYVVLSNIQRCKENLFYVLKKVFWVYFSKTKMYTTSTLNKLTNKR